MSIAEKNGAQMEDILESLAQVDLVQVTWRTPDNFSKSSNGGDYEFWSEFSPRPDGLWEEEEFSSADFSFCPRGQGFQSCFRCSYWRDGKCTLPPRTFSTQELARKIAPYPMKIRTSRFQEELSILDVDATRKEGI